MNVKRTSGPNFVESDLASARAGEAEEEVCACAIPSSRTVSRTESRLEARCIFIGLLSISAPPACTTDEETAVAIGVLLLLLETGAEGCLVAESLCFIWAFLLVGAKLMSADKVL